MRVFRRGGASVDGPSGIASGRWRAWLLIPIGAFLALGLTVAWMAATVYGPGSPRKGPAVRVVVRAGMTADGVASLLRADHVIPSAWWFRTLVRFHHDAARLKAGTYLFGHGMSLAAVLGALVAGRVAYVRVVVPEGWTASRIVRTLAHHHLGERGALRAAADAPVVLRAAGLPSPRRGVRIALEGYLFPATYRFPLGATPSQLMTTMVQRFRLAWTPALARAARRRTGLDAEETVTLASIVQAEVRTPAQMALVAGVYVNRWRKGMDLDADPTVLYGLGLLGTQTTPLTDRELASKSPFNTYRHRGWPPGPICNPGQTALDAAAAPAHVSALYFLTTPGGRLVLADTLAQQTANARRYGVS